MFFFNKKLRLKKKHFNALKQYGKKLVKNSLIKART